MKRVIISALVATATLMMNGCASKTPQEVKNESFKKEAKCFNAMPEWIKNPSVENGLGAVGIGKYTKGGPSFMIPEAEMYGRRNLAAEIKTEISSLQHGNKRKMNIPNLDLYESNFREVVETFIDKLSISGAKRIKTYQSACTGDMYVLMAIDFKILENSLENSKAKLRQNMQQAKMSREAIDEGMKVLDEDISRLREKYNHENTQTR